MQKRMWKVITPVEKKDGTKYWSRLGTAFTNKDDSINIYLDSIPFAATKETVLQLREMTDEDFRRSPQGNNNNNAGGFVPGPAKPASNNDALPF